MRSPPARPALYQVVVRRPGYAAATVPLNAFPFVIGRSPEASLVLDGPGIWPRHLGLEVHADQGLVVSVEAGALATLDNRPLERRRVRHGDVVRVGAVHLQFLVSPPVRRSLAGWEVAVWVLLAGVILAQVWVVWAIPRE